MNICFYSPYLPDHFGGGEKHFFDVIKAAMKHHQVTVAIPSYKIAHDRPLHDFKILYEEFLGWSLKDVSFIESPLGTSESAIQKILWTNQFDGMYYVTDGSFFVSLAKHNFVHFQIPFREKLNTANRIKLLFWKHRNANSHFTKDWIEANWNIYIDQVLHPMVDVELLKSAEKKEKIILNVGRFFKQLHSKRQDVLVRLFSSLLKKFPKESKGWKLLLIGSVEDSTYFDQVKLAVKGLPIEIITSVNRTKLIEYYKKASIYWHATGYDIDESIYPEKVEHFGISTIEAMAAGCIPIVHYKGGQKEVLGKDLEFLGWKTDEECIEKTIEILKSSQKRNDYRHISESQSEKFNKNIFNKKVEKLFSY